jgi:hypothetical protein
MIREPEKPFVSQSDPKSVGFTFYSDGRMEVVRRNACGESELIEYPAAPEGVTLLVVTAQPGGAGGPVFELTVKRISEGQCADCGNVITDPQAQCAAYADMSYTQKCRTRDVR